MVRAILIVIAIVVGGTGCSSVDIVEEHSAPDMASTNALNHLKPGEYILVSTQDVSYALARRVIGRIRVNFGLSRSDIEATLKNAASDLQQRYRARAVSVFAYGPGDSVDQDFTVGMTNYAPHGDWARAGEDGPLEFSITIGESYFTEVQRRQDFAAGTVVQLLAKQDETISISPTAENREPVIATVTAGTKAKIIDSRTWSMAGSNLVRYRIQVYSNGMPSVTGWVDQRHIEH